MGSGEDLLPALTLQSPQMVLASSDRKRLEDVAEACGNIIVKAITQRRRLVVTSLRGKLGRWVKLCFPQVIH